MKKLFCLSLLLLSFSFSYSQSKKPQKTKKQKVYVDNYKLIDDFTYPLVLANGDTTYVYDFDKWSKYKQDSIPKYIIEQRKTGVHNGNGLKTFYKKGQ